MALYARLLAETTVWIYFGEYLVVSAIFKAVRECRADNVYMCASIGLGVVGVMLLYIACGIINIRQDVKDVVAKLPPLRMRKEWIALWGLTNLVQITYATLYFIKNKPVLVDLDADVNHTTFYLLHLVVGLTYVAGTWLFVMCYLIPVFLLKAIDSRAFFGCQPASEESCGVDKTLITYHEIA